MSSVDNTKMNAYFCSSLFALLHTQQPFCDALLCENNLTFAEKIMLLQLNGQFRRCFVHRKQALLQQFLQDSYLTRNELLDRLLSCRMPDDSFFKQVFVNLHLKIQPSRYTISLLVSNENTFFCTKLYPNGLEFASTSQMQYYRSANDTDASFRQQIIETLNRMQIQSNVNVFEFCPNLGLIQCTQFQIQPATFVKQALAARHKSFEKIFM